MNKHEGENSMVLPSADEYDQPEEELYEEMRQREVDWYDAKEIQAEQQKGRDELCDVLADIAGTHLGD